MQANRNHPRAGDRQPQCGGDFDATLLQPARQAGTSIDGNPGMGPAAHVKCVVDK